MMPTVLRRLFDRHSSTHVGVKRVRNHRRNPIIAGEICWPIVDFLGFGADLVAFATAQVFDFIGRSSKIRTYDPHVPNVVLYQAELYSDEGGLIAPAL